MSERYDELLRWAAEDVLGWTRSPWEGTWIANPDDPYVMTQRSAGNLLGWPGFGLAVEAARARGIALAWWDQGHYEDEGTPSCKVISRPKNDGPRSTFFDTDPALAAWAALREAVRDD